jgi:spore coat protein CotF
MKLSKSDIMLNEKDTLLDLLNAEKGLMTIYSTALFEGSTKSVRKSFSENLLSVADDQYSIFCQLSTRGYITPKPAPKTSIDEANDMFKKEKKSLKDKAE